MRFDIDADGDRDFMAWTRNGSVAFLVFDRNGNGIPDDGSELFGEHTPLRNGAKAAHGFEALAEFDAKGDGAVIPADSLWTQLKVWRDFDHDGVATQSEMSLLAEAGVASTDVLRRLSSDAMLPGRMPGRGGRDARPPGRGIIAAVR